MSKSNKCSGIKRQKANSLKDQKQFQLDDSSKKPSNSDKVEVENNIFLSFSATLPHSKEIPLESSLSSDQSCDIFQKPEVVNKKTSKKPDSSKKPSNSAKVEVENNIFLSPSASSPHSKEIPLESSLSTDPSGDNLQKPEVVNKKTSKKPDSSKKPSNSAKVEVENNIFLSPSATLPHSEEIPLASSLSSDQSSHIFQKPEVVNKKTSKKPDLSKKPSNSANVEVENNIFLSASATLPHSEEILLESSLSSDPSGDNLQKPVVVNKKTSKKPDSSKEPSNSAKVEVENNIFLSPSATSPHSKEIPLESFLSSDQSSDIFQKPEVVNKKTPATSPHFDGIPLESSLSSNPDGDILQKPLATLPHSEEIPLESSLSSDQSSEIFQKPEVVNKKTSKKFKSSAEVEVENGPFPSPPATPPHSESFPLSSSASSYISQRLEDIKKKKNFDSSKNQNATNVYLCNLSKKQILSHLKKETNFNWEEANTGSYYDKTQVSQAVEFDVMMYLKNRPIKVIYFPDTENENMSMCSLFMSSSVNCEHFLREILGAETESKQSIYLSPKKFYHEFKSLVTSFFQNPSQEFRKGVENKGFSYEIGKLTIEPAKTKPGCPAVTLNVNNFGETLFSMDFVPAIQLVEWPKPAENWTCNWIPENIIKCLKNCSDVAVEKTPELNYFRNKYVFSVPKLDPGEIDKDSEKCKFWQLSFGEIEKCIILYTKGKFYGSSHCTKDVLKLLKQDVNELNKQLNTEDKLISSYHMKQLVFSVRSNCKTENYWLKGNRPICYKECLIEFFEKIRDENLPMFFLPNVNLLKDRFGEINKENILLFIKNKLKAISNASQVDSVEVGSSLPEDVVCSI